MHTPREGRQDGAHAVQTSAETDQLINQCSDRASDEVTCGGVWGGGGLSCVFLLLFSEGVCMHWRTVPFCRILALLRCALDQLKVTIEAR